MLAMTCCLLRNFVNLNQIGQAAGTKGNAGRNHHFITRHLAQAAERQLRSALTFYLYW
jgi:hypothetical protein